MIEVKICGVCRPADAAAAVAAGADYVGVILAPGRGRSRTPEEAAAIFAAAGGASRVGVFVDASVAEAVESAARLGLDVVQLHGGESADAVRAIRSGGWRVWKALRPRSAEELEAGVAEFGDVADALLLDGWSARGAGGTGARLPWTALAPARAALPPRLRVVAAGGLNAANVAEAMSLLRPDVVDVSSGVESRLGSKDEARVRAFVAAARAAAEPRVPPRPAADP